MYFSMSIIDFQYIHSMRIIVPAIPHTVTNQDFVGCAFTQKVLKFVKMMSGRGHEIYHVGHADSKIWPAPDVHHITVIDNHVLRKSYGNDYVDQQSWKELGFSRFFNNDDHAHEHFNREAIKAIKPLLTNNTVIVGFWGYGHKPIADAFPEVPFIEGGIGYLGAFSQWRIYESHAVMNALAQPESVINCWQSWYHRVIPNYFDADDFDYRPRDQKKDYILYLGRISNAKGVDIAIQATEAAGRKLLIAGQGSLEEIGIMKKPAHVELVGYADVDTRRLLLSEAAGLIIASKYLEPFAGVQVEAWLSGTPVISPNYAAFAELNQHSSTGFRCNVFRDFVKACQSIDLIPPELCRQHGEQFLLAQIAPMYEDYFQDVLDVYHQKGWYTWR